MQYNILKEIIQGACAYRKTFAKVDKTAVDDDTIGDWVYTQMHDCLGMPIDC